MTPEEIDAKPAFVPAHKMPVWLSSEDVKATIIELADAGVDKAACWDFMQAIYRLVERTYLESNRTPRNALDGREGGDA